MTTDKKFLEAENTKWTPFYLVTRQHDGVVDSEEVWKKVRVKHTTQEDGQSILVVTKDNPEFNDNYGMKKFDFHPYVFDEVAEAARTSLLDWAASQGMDLAA